MLWCVRLVGATQYGLWHRGYAIAVQERARLDVGYVDQRGSLDVSLVATAIVTAEGLARQLERRAVFEHRRYPGPGFVPFVLDVRGRWGVEAQVWARGIARTTAANAGKAIADLRWRVAQARQVKVADQCYRTSGTSARAPHPNAPAAAVLAVLAASSFRAPASARLVAAPHEAGGLCTSARPRELGGPRRRCVAPPASWRHGACHSWCHACVGRRCAWSALCGARRRWWRPRR